MNARIADSNALDRPLRVAAAMVIATIALLVWASSAQAEAIEYGKGWSERVVVPSKGNVSFTSTDLIVRSDSHSKRRAGTFAPISKVDARRVPKGVSLYWGLRLIDRARYKGSNDRGNAGKATYILSMVAINKNATGRTPKRITSRTAVPKDMEIGHDPYVGGFHMERSNVIDQTKNLNRCEFNSGNGYRESFAISPLKGYSRFSMGSILGHAIALSCDDTPFKGMTKFLKSFGGKLPPGGALNPVGISCVVTAKRVSKIAEPTYDVSSSCNKATTGVTIYTTGKITAAAALSGFSSSGQAGNRAGQDLLALPALAANQTGVVRITIKPGSYHSNRPRFGMTPTLADGEGPLAFAL